MSSNCPKCGYVRRLSDTAPEWQCPSCGVAYSKVKSKLEASKNKNPKSKASKAQIENAPEKSKFTTRYNKEIVKLLVIGFICLILGYFAGREHIKYEFKQRMNNIGQSLNKTMSEAFNTPEVSTKSRSKPKDENGKVPEPSNWKKTCSTIADMAESIMKSRQDGIAISVVMDLLPSVGLSGNGAEAVESLIITAYKKPRYNTEKHIKRSIENFKNYGYMDCVKDLR